jgi:hypothetical protein
MTTATERHAFGATTANYFSSISSVFSPMWIIIANMALLIDNKR